MTLTNDIFEAMMSDTSKRIDGDIEWEKDEDHSPSPEFRVEVMSDPGWPIFVRGSYNPLIPALTYAIILKTTGRVYGLDMGKDHHNPQCGQVGRMHKHTWKETFRDKEAYCPTDIDAPVTDPVAVWKQFCAEAGIAHNGRLAPIQIQEKLFPEEFFP